MLLQNSCGIPVGTVVDETTFALEELCLDQKIRLSHRQCFILMSMASGSRQASLPKLQAITRNANHLPAPNKHALCSPHTSSKGFLLPALNIEAVSKLQVEWEEKWWEASDWAGMKEMGAEKSGCRADGAAWRETWREAIGFDEDSGEPMVERTAHKWAQDAAVRTAFVLMPLTCIIYTTIRCITVEKVTVQIFITLRAFLHHKCRMLALYARCCISGMGCCRQAICCKTLSK